MNTNYLSSLIFQIIMATDVEIADEELLLRLKAELERPVDDAVSQTPVDYYHQNKDKVEFNKLL